MAIATDQVARIFVLLESINFAMMRDEFESASAWKKVAAGENTLEVALNITRRFVPLMAISADDLKVLTAVLNTIVEVAGNSTPSAICTPRPLPHLPAIAPDDDFGPAEAVPALQLSLAKEPN
jgi:hypothetical protein